MVNGHSVFLYPNGDVYIGQWAEASASFYGSLNAGTGQRRSTPPPMTPSASSSSLKSRQGRAAGDARRAAKRCALEAGSTSASSSSSEGSCSSGADPGPVPGAPSRQESAPRLAYGPAPCRQGWGVFLRGHERYEGEWRRDERHGLGCVNPRAAERFVGCFEAGDRASGVAVSRTGVLHAEVWRHGRLVSRRPLFASPAESRAPPTDSDAATRSPSVSSSSSSRAAPREGQRLPSPTRNGSGADGNEDVSCGPRNDESEEERRSNLALMDAWTPRQVARLARQVGLGDGVAKRLREQRVDGMALGSLVLRSASGARRALLKDPECVDAALFRARRRLLVLLLELCLKFRHKQLSPLLSLDAVRTLYPGLEIHEDQITFEEIVGEGGYGRVYRARWMNADVAAKVFRGGDPGEGLLPRGFAAELDVLCRLRHPNITLLTGFCFRPKSTIVTEFIHGGSLYDVLHGRRRMTEWNLSLVVRIAREICLGMAYLHMNDVVHCDLKSSNVLLNGPREVKLCDFGLAHLLGGETAMQERMGIAIGCVGTHHWMAPEVLRGEEFSKASDAYSFGMILWEMISRKVPFEGYTALQVVGLVGYGRRRPQVPGGCPQPLRVLLHKLLRPRSRTRCDFEELADELGGLHRSAVVEVEESLWTFFGG